LLSPFLPLPSRKNFISCVAIYRFGFTEQNTFGCFQGKVYPYSFLMTHMYGIAITYGVVSLLLLGGL